MAPHALRRDEYFPEIILDRAAVRVSGIIARVADANVCRVLCSGCPEQPQEPQEHVTNAQVSRRRRNLGEFPSVRARGCRAAELLVLLAITCIFLLELNKLKQSLRGGVKLRGCRLAATSDWLLVC